MTHLGVTQPYTYSPNGNLLQTGALTNTFDGANRLVQSERDQAVVHPLYNGVGDRVAQTAGAVTTQYTLDVEGLPEVIHTSEGNAFLHLPGVIVAESSTGETRYLLGDGLGSVRQAVDEAGAVVAYNEYDPYGSPVQTGSEPYGFSREWWQEELGLLHLRARWLMPYLNQFISPDPIIPDYFKPQSLNQYSYAYNNPVNLTDPTGLTPNCESRKCKVELLSTRVQAGFGLLGFSGHLSIVFTNYNEDVYTVEGMPEHDPFSGDPGRVIMFGPHEDQTKQEAALPGILRETGQYGATFITLAEGEEVCSKWECLKNKMQLIESKNIPYNPWGPNSNTAVYSAVKACGLPTSGPQYNVGMWRTHQGWGIDLLSNYPEPVPVPTPPTGTPQLPAIPMNPAVPVVPTPNPLSTSIPAGI